MKTIKYAIVMMLGVFLMTSCEQDNGFVNNVQDGPNLALFVNQSKDVSRIANGNTFDIGVPVQIAGPHMKDVSGDVTITVEPDFTDIPDSTVTDTTISGPGGSTALRAEQGVNFSIPKNTLTLKESNNYVGTFHFTMLTQGVSAPLATAKELNLKVTDVSGAGSVKGSGKPLNVKLTYACASYLEGVYNVSLNGSPRRENIKVVQTGVGKYESEVFPPFGFKNGPPNQLTEGLRFSDNCSKLSILNETLAQFSNKVSNTKTSITGDSRVKGDVTSFTLTYAIEGQGTFRSKFTYVGPLP